MSAFNVEYENRLQKVILAVNHACEYDSIQPIAPF